MLARLADICLITFNASVLGGWGIGLKIVKCDGNSRQLGAKIKTPSPTHGALSPQVSVYP